MPTATVVYNEFEIDQIFLLSLDTFGDMKCEKGIEGVK